MDAVQVVATVAAGLIALSIALVATGVGLVAGLGPALVAAGVLIGVGAGWCARELLREDSPAAREVRVLRAERGTS